MKKRIKLNEIQKERVLKIALKIIGGDGYTADEVDEIFDALNINYWMQTEDAARRLLVDAILKRNAFRE